MAINWFLILVLFGAMTLTLITLILNVFDFQMLVFDNSVENPCEIHSLCLGFCEWVLCGCSGVTRAVSVVARLLLAKVKRAHPPALDTCMARVLPSMQV